MIDNPSFLNNCRSPYIVKSLHGEQQLCRCGKCVDCQNSRSVYYTEMIKRASSEFRYTYFFTLTYNEKCVPRVILQEETLLNVSDEDIQLGLNYFNSQEIKDNSTSLVARSITARPRKKSELPYKKVPEYNSIMFKIPFNKLDNENFQKFYSKTKVYSKYATQSEIDYYNSHYILRVLRKKDVQNFLKILRFNISTCPNLDNNPSISYFFVGEYGPTTFRPHYHGLLFFNEPQLLENIENLLVSSWKFGKVEDPGLARDSGQCCNYVASYCNSYSYLPDYLSFKSIKPFSLHSIFLGSYYLKDLRPLVYENPSNFYGETDISLNGSPFHFAPTTQMLSHLFPRCYNYRHQLPQLRTFLYETFNKLAIKFQSNKLSDLTRYVLTSDDYVCKKLLTLLDIIPNATPPLQLSINSPLVTSFDIPYSDFTEYMQTIYNRVYTAISTSKLFCFLANKYFNGNYRQFAKLIDNYYNRRALFQLKMQYETMIEYYKHHATPLTFFDILHNTRKYPITDYMHHLYMYDIFYFNSPNYFKSLSKCSLLNNHKTQKDSYYRKKVKHKELNDANLIFVNVLN